MILLLGLPIKGSALPVDLRGRRQEWVYSITYAGGDTQAFYLPCPSLPFHISRDIALERAGLAIRQKMQPAWCRDKESIHCSVDKVLRNRRDSVYISEWNSFFSNIPKDDISMPHPSYVDALRQLYFYHGGKVQPKVDAFQTIQRPIDIVDSLTFAGGPVSDAERKEVLAKITGVVQQLKVRKVKDPLAPKKPRGRPKKTPLADSPVIPEENNVTTKASLPALKKIKKVPTKVVAIDNSDGEASCSDKSDSDRSDKSPSLYDSDDCDSEILANDGMDIQEEPLIAVWSYSALKTIPKEFAAKIGAIFIDTTDNSTNQIVSVSKCDQTGDAVFDYKCSASSEIEHTECTEILTASWAQWTVHSSASTPHTIEHDSGVGKKRKRITKTVAYVPIAEKWKDESKIDKSNIIGGSLAKRSRRNASIAL